jgi:hypothetical protein
MRYGQMTFTNEPFGNFIGNFNEPALEENFFEKLIKKAKLQVGLEQ